MKKICFLLMFLFAAADFYCQVKAPVKWSFACRKTGESTYEIGLTAQVSPGWHIYSQTTPECGPFATMISFTKSPMIELEGEAKELGSLEQKHEPLFGVDVKQFSNKVVFVQKIRMKAKVKTAVKGNIEFMTCNNRECLPPKTESFSISIQ